MPHAQLRRIVTQSRFLGTHHCVAVTAEHLAGLVMASTQYLSAEVRSTFPPSTYRYDVLFLKEPLTSAKAMKEVMVREGVDAAYPGPGVIYFSRLAQRATQSRLSRIVSLPVYQYMTIRNWNTTTKLLALMDARGR